jgi:glycosyltransferase involved in cell wall biosynthesis
MDICVLNPFFYPYKGGTEKVLLEVYSRLSKRHNITIITSAPEDKNHEHREEIAGIDVIRLRANRVHLPGLPLPFLSFEGLNRAITAQKADLYHVNNRYQYMYFNLSLIKGRGKLALTIHNSLPIGIDALTDAGGLLYDILWGRRIMKRSDLITGVSKNAIDSTVPAGLLPKAHVVYNGVDYKNFRRISRRDPEVRSLAESIGLEGQTIVCTARLIPQKGHIHLMRAVAALYDAGSRPNLLLLGMGPMERELRMTAKRLGIDKGLRIRYGLGDDVLPKYYALGDASAIPSIYEPASLAALESMACELPILASRVGGLPEMVGNAGIYARPGDPVGIADGLSRILEDRSLARRLGANGRKRAIERHSWDRISKRYEELFLKTVGS